MMKSKKKEFGKRKSTRHTSDKIFILVLALAFVITFIGTGFSVLKLADFKLQENILTGAAINTTTGTSTLTVQSVTQITNRVSTIAFGSGSVNSTCGYCMMDSETGIYPGNRSCCLSFNNVTAGFLIENTGNINVTLNFSCTGSCSASSFIGGTGSLFQFKATNASRVTNQTATNKSADTFGDQADSCSSGSSSSYNYTSYTNLAAAPSGFYLCGDNVTSKYFMDFNDTQDAVVVDLKVKIPSDAPATGAKTATFTFFGESSG